MHDEKRVSFDRAFILGTVVGLVLVRVAVVDNSLFPEQSGSRS